MSWRSNSKHVSDYVTDDDLKALLDGTNGLSAKDLSNGLGVSASQVAEWQYNRNEAQAERDWNEQMYNQYESPAAMVRQYEEAGLNPALMYGSADSGSVMSSSAASATGSQPSNSPQDSPMTVVSALMQLLSGGASIRQSLQQGNAAARNAESAAKDADTRARQQDLAERRYDEVEVQAAADAHNSSVAAANKMIAEKDLTDTQRNMVQRNLDFFNETYDIAVRAKSLEADKLDAEVKDLRNQIYNRNRLTDAQLNEIDAKILNLAEQARYYSAAAMETSSRDSLEQQEWWMNESMSDLTLEKLGIEVEHLDDESEQYTTRYVIDKLLQTGLSIAQILLLLRGIKTMRPTTTQTRSYTSIYGPDGRPASTSTYRDVVLN